MTQREKASEILVVEAAGALRCARVVAAHPEIEAVYAVQVGDEPRPIWARSLRGQVPRTGDRVLLATVPDIDEPIIHGIVDGPKARPPRRLEALGELRLDAAGALRVTSPDGTPLFDLGCDETGAPVVRVASRDLAIEIEGAFRVRAGEIEIAARAGGVAVEASDDVTVRGETINLN